MAKKKEETFIGTHARLLISDWGVLADLITEHSQLVKERVQGDFVEEEEAETASVTHAISRREIEDALNGPMQAFFKQKLTAYMKLSLIRMNLNMQEDETFKDKRADIPDADKVPTSILQNTSPADLKSIQKALDQLTTEHAEAWQRSRDEWNQKILEQLNEQGLSLSEIETKEFLDPEPISELLNRFVALNIDLPKTRKSEMNFSKYLTLKADITIQSALSRQHMPNTQNDIQKILNKLKADFNAIAKQEKTIIDAQKSETNEAVAEISW